MSEENIGHKDSKAVQMYGREFRTLDYRELQGESIRVEL
jgi:hypothetical protein